MRSPEMAERVGDTRRPPPRGRGLYRRPRQRQPADAERGVGHRQLDRRAGLPVRGRSVDRQPGDRVFDGRRPTPRSRVRWAISRPGPAATCSWPARRPHAARPRGKSSTSCVINISSRLNRAAHRAGIRSWSVRATRTSPCGPGVDILPGNLARVRIRRIDYVTEVLHGSSPHGSGRWRHHGVRHARSSSGRASARSTPRWIRSAAPSRKRRSGRGRTRAGSPKSIRRPRQPLRQPLSSAAGQSGGGRGAERRERGRHASRRQVRRDRQGQPPAGVRSRAQRGSGQLQVRPDRSFPTKPRRRSTRWSSS